MRNIVYLAFILSVVVQMTFASSLSGPAPIPPPPNFYITSAVTTVCRGQINEIPISVTNKANVKPVYNTNVSFIGQNPTMQDVSVGFVNTHGVYPYGNGTVVFGAINPNTTATRDVPVFVSGNASDFLFSEIGIGYYYDSDTYSDSEIRNITFTTKTCATPLSVNVSPQVLTSGVIQNITVNLTNSGSSVLNNISLRISLPTQDGAVLSKQPVQIPAINPDSKMKINEEVYVAGNESDQSVPLNLSLIFYNGSRVNQIYDNLAVLSSGLIAISPSEFAASPTNPSPNGIFSVSFVLTNTGTASASSLEATPIPPRGFSNFGTNTVFVGSITPGGQTPVTVSLFASNSVKPGTYVIPIRLNYMNNLRQNMTIWANTSVSVAYSAANYTQFVHAHTGGGGGLFTLVLLALVVILAIMYYRQRKVLRSSRRSR